MIRFCLSRLELKLWGRFRYYIKRMLFATAANNTTEFRFCGSALSRRYVRGHLHAHKITTNRVRHCCPLSERKVTQALFPGDYIVQVKLGRYKKELDYIMGRRDIKCKKKQKHVIKVDCQASQPSGTGSRDLRKWRNSVITTVNLAGYKVTSISV